jgi:hypothetical protein
VSGRALLLGLNGLAEEPRCGGPEHLSPASVLAVLLEMDCIEPPRVNPLQRIPHSAAEQGTRRTTALQLATALQVGVSHRDRCSPPQPCQHAPGADPESALQHNGTVRQARRRSWTSGPDRRLTGPLTQALRPGLLGHARRSRPRSSWYRKVSASRDSSRQGKASFSVWATCSRKRRVVLP